MVITSIGSASGERPFGGESTDVLNVNAPLELTHERMAKPQRRVPTGRDGIDSTAARSKAEYPRTGTVRECLEQLSAPAPSAVSRFSRSKKGPMDLGLFGSWQGAQGRASMIARRGGSSQRHKVSNGVGNPLAVAAEHGADKVSFDEREVAGFRRVQGRAVARRSSAAS